MKLNNINVSSAIADAEKLLAEEKDISPGLKASMKLILVLVQTMVDRLSLNSKNSSKPPSTDKKKKKSSKKKGKSKRKPGGQPGRIGKQLKPVDNPDEVETIKIDKRTLPKDEYQEIGYESRQVIDFTVSLFVKEYRAQILVNSDGKRYVGKFPAYVTRPVQYGSKTKATSVYMSQFQLTPYNRIQDYFLDQIDLNVSSGSLFNFNKEAYEQLAYFDKIAKSKLIVSSMLNVDETGININGKRLWLHTAGNNKWTYFYPHHKRGCAAMDEIGIIPKFNGVLCHDHWKPYYRYTCLHALCNAHHLRELEWSATEDNQRWAKKLSNFLVKLKDKVAEAGGKLIKKQCDYYRRRYRALLSDAQTECPEPKREEGQRGRLKRSKSRNLLQRLINYENDVLRFMENADVHFTNNQGENDLRMTKVQQKISGCFRSEEGARIFCRIRAYLITCRKHGIGATAALESLFRGELPDFINDS